MLTKIFAISFLAVLIIVPWVFLGRRHTRAAGLGGSDLGDAAGTPHGSHDGGDFAGGDSGGHH